MEHAIFVDDSMIARKTGVIRRVHAGRKLDKAVMKAETPSEYDGKDRRIYLYGTVLPNPSGGYRMWYHNAANRVLYATSIDGVHWERPNLGLVEFEGARDNNILPIRLHSISIVFDEKDSDPNQRYKMLGCGRNPEPIGYCVACSPDGFDWKLYSDNPAILGSDTCTLAHDTQTGEYLAFHKHYNELRGHKRRLVYLSVSPDMQQWSEPVLVMAPDETDDEQTRAEGGINSQYYNMSAFLYGGQWLGLVTHFRYSGTPERTGPEQTGPEQSPHDGPIDVQLVHSRNGRNWDKCEDRSPVIPNGPHPYDAGCILGVANQPVIAGDEMWIYYTAITTTHGGFVPEKEITIARAAWRLDGWVSLAAGAAGGVVETVDVEPKGEALWVNADVGGGELRVEVLDATGAVIRGYGAEDCLPLRENGVRQVVRWQDQNVLPKARPIRLRFLPQNARLFSWWAE